MLAAQINQIREIYRRLGARIAQAQVRGYVAALSQLRSFTLAPNQRGPLARLYADAATLAGWHCVDFGDLAQAWRYYEAAKDAAREGGPPSALAHATAEQAYVLVELGEVTSALQLAKQARAIAGTAVPPLLRSWLAAVLGELHAAMRNHAACSRAFGAAEKLMPGGPKDSELPNVFLDGVHLTRWRGSARATLGEAAATDDLRRAVYGLDSSFTRAKAGLHVDLAAAFAAARRYDEARAQLHQAAALATRVGSVRQRRRIRHLMSRLHTA